MEDLDEIRIKESQVKEIISMLKDEFNLTETDETINSELNINNNKDSNNNDEGYNGDTNSVDDEPESSNGGGGGGGDLLNTQDDNKNFAASAQSEFEDEEYMTNENDIIESNENRLEKFNQIMEFVDKAIEFGANALDLSKRGLKKLPKNLIMLENLQYLYLEGNRLSTLPKSFFIDFPNLKWLDLRNNDLVELASEGLDTHENIRYLLIENNKLGRLPCEIGNLGNLTALNLDNNPLEYPPLDVVAKGLKAVIEYLREDYVKLRGANSHEKRKKSNNETGINYSYYYDDSLVTDDVWASDTEETSINGRTRSSRSRSTSNLNASPDRRAKTGRSFLMASKMNASEGKDQDMRDRLQKAKENANKLSKTMTNLLYKRKSLPPPQINVYKNEDYEKACITGKLDKYKKNREKIDAKLQKANDTKLVYDFRDKLRVQQRKLMNKRLQKGIDYTEPVRKAPFDISDDYLMVMSKKDRELLDKRLEAMRNRPLSPETLMRIEDERRARDHVLQEKIREYSTKLLNRREEGKSENPKYDRIQAAKDIRELRVIQRELEERRMEIQFNLRAYTGGLVFRETAKLNKKATVANILKRK